jgi:DNA-binding transcriptional LysR family regulator
MFEIELLRTFLAVVETRHFTAAGQALGLSQSTISQHIRRLELAAGRQLLERDTHGVALTVDGNVMADYAREIVEVSRRAAEHFADTAPRGRVRFGVSEDLTLTRLPAILRDFTASHPLLSLELSVGLTSALYQKLDAGRLDLVFAKRRPGDDRGQVIWREALMWMAHRQFVLDGEAPAPLVMYPSGSITSALAVEALNKARRPWFVACSSETLSGLRAAVQAGLGVTAQSALLLHGGDLAQAPASAALPDCGEIEFVVLGRSARLQGAPAALAEVVMQRGPELWSMA